MSGWKPVAPGEILSEWCEENNVSQRVAAKACGRMRQETFDGIVDGDCEITPELAERLAVGTGIGAQVWLRLEGNYRASLVDE